MHINSFNEESTINLDDDNDFRLHDTDSYDESGNEMDTDVVMKMVKKWMLIKMLSTKNYLDLTMDDIYGMSFTTENDACTFYYAYAKCHGFGIRKDEIKHNVNRNIVMRPFLYNKVGLRNKRHFMRDDRKKNHIPQTRTDCKAKLRVRVDPSTTRWKVVSFIESHNHHLCPSKFVPLIRTYRGLSNADKAQVDCLHAQGVRTCHIMGYMMDKKGGHIGLSFNKKDLNNHVERHKRSLIKDVDVLAALSYLQGKEDNDPMFFQDTLLQMMAS